jgi:hypothetical protein
LLLGHYSKKRSTICCSTFPLGSAEDAASGRPDSVH